MKAWICVPLMALALAGCAGKTAYRDSCGSQLDAAWHELDLAKAEGFAGTVSYSKALSLLTAAICRRFSRVSTLPHFSRVLRSNAATP